MANRISFMFASHPDPLEEGMAIHSSILAWRSPWTEEPRGLGYMRLQRVGHNRVTKHSKQHVFIGWAIS